MIEDMVFPPFVLITFVVLIFSLVCAFVKKKRYNLPPGPRGLPILGYLPFLGKDAVVEFQKLRKKYGDVFSLYLGRRLVVVVTDAIAAKQLFNMPALSDRPDDLFMLLPGGTGFTASNGLEWLEQRRFTLMEMKNLGLGRSHWEKLIELEVCDFLDMLSKSKEQPIDIYEELSASISDNILSFVTGRRLPVGHPKRKILDLGLDSFFSIYIQSGLISQFPTLFKFCAEYGLIGVGQKMKNVENMSRCIRENIKESKERNEGEFYIQKYFDEIEKNQQLHLRNSFNEQNLLGNVQSLIIAGSDTTKVSLMWLILAMASFPDTQDKVHEEIDSVLGKEGKAAWADRQKLPYCHAAILEGQRWRTVVPLNLQHRTAEDVVFKEYDIPKGTHVITVLAAFHNDPKFWTDPNLFQPERFLTDAGKVVPDHESYLPFSSGKRMCPAKTVALIEIFLYFVAIMQKFRILPASEIIKPDLEGIPGLTLQPKRQTLRFVLR